MLITTGERISMSLLCMALADLGVEAVSFTGSQAGIITDSMHGKAKILEVKGDRVREALAAGKVCVVAGFQGISTEKEITSLGRGGSDTTAVGAGRSARRRQLRDLHRRHRRVLRRSAHRPPGPQAGQRQLRRDARDGRRRQQGARTAQRRVRPQPQRSRPRPLRLHVGAGHVGHRSGAKHGRADHLRRRHRHQRVEGHHRRRPRPARHRGGAVRAARRGQRQRRHDRAEHVARRHHRHQLHDAEGRHGHGRVDRQPCRRRDRRHGVSITMPTSPRSAWSAQA